MYVLLAILIFGLLVFVHELGHFLTAKSLDVRVNEFSVCMGPALFKKQVGETTYALRCIPIGGYCAMEGEDEASEDPRAFSSKAWWKRLIILAAGSFMNFLAGFLIIVLLYSASAGFSTARIARFYDGCPLQAEDALQIGDEFYRIDGRRVYQYSDISMLLDRNKTGVYDLVVRRSGKLVTLNDFPMQMQEYVVDGQTEYRYGIYFASEEKTPFTLLKQSWYTACNFARMVSMGLEDLITGLVSVDEMSGPVGIVSIIAETGETSETVSAGLRNIAFLAAFLAINLAVMNLLPLPALDGGRIFFLLVGTAYTAVCKKKIPEQVEGYIHAAGMVLLLVFMAFVTFKDIWKLIV